MIQAIYLKCCLFNCILLKFYLKYFKRIQSYKLYKPTLSIIVIIWRHHLPRRDFITEKERLSHKFYEKKLYQNISWQFLFWLQHKFMDIWKKKFFLEAIDLFLSPLLLEEENNIKECIPALWFFLLLMLDKRR